MNLPIETLLINEVKAGIATVLGDPSLVFVDPARVLHEEISKPYSCVMTEPRRCKKVALYSEKSFNIQIHTTLKADTDESARAQAVLLDAQIQEQLLPIGSSVRKYCQYFEQEEDNCSDVYYWMEGTCTVWSRYSVKYRHAYGKPTQQNP